MMKMTTKCSLLLAEQKIFPLDFNDLEEQNTEYFASIKDFSSLWHRRPGPASMKLITKLSHDEHVHGFPKLKFEKVHLRDACQMGKQIKNYFKSKSMISTSRPL